MKALLVSPFIDPDAVGEPRWCYDLAKAISGRTETVIVTQTPRKRSFTVAELFPQSEVYEHKPWELDQLPKRAHALIKPNYALFYRKARQVIRRQLDLRTIGCAHHFGPLALRYPTPLYDSGIPYIMGPLGGSLPTPPGFGGKSSSQPWYYKLRDIDALRFRFDPWLRASYQNAACVVGVADYVRDVLGGMKLKDFACSPEVAAREPVADISGVMDARRTRRGDVRFLVVSRLIFSKGVQYVLRAAERLAHLPGWYIDILGDGPMRADLEAGIGALSLSDRITVHGHVPRARVDDFYRSSDVFLFPSIREPSGAVVFEAMSWGLPMICADYGGPAAHVDASFGHRVGVGSEGEFVSGFAQAMHMMMDSAETRYVMGQAALSSARTRHSVEAMADFFVSLYKRHAR